MIVSYERTGGFAGLQIMLNVDSDSLPAEESASLQKLIHDADFFDLQEESPTEFTRADGFHYTISVQADGKQRTLNLTNGYIPEKLQPLVEDLSIRARSRGRMT